MQTRKLTQPASPNPKKLCKGRFFRGFQSTILSVILTLGMTSPTLASETNTYPTKAITIVVGFPPGGPNDRLARELGNHLSKRLQQPVVIENRPGANSEIAANHVARAAADGYTLLFTSNGALAVSPSLKSNLPYDPTKDFAPVAVIAENPMVLVVSASSKFHSLEDLLKEARENPGKLTFASAGIGSPTQLAAELMKISANFDALHVPYKGGGPALVDLVCGQVDFYFGGIATALPLIQLGRLRALAVTSSERSSQLPEVGTLDELALRGYEASLWYSVLAPKNTPSETIDFLYENIASIMAAPEMQKTLTNDGSKTLIMAPAQFRDYLKADSENELKSLVEPDLFIISCTAARRAALYRAG